MTRNRELALALRMSPQVVTATVLEERPTQRSQCRLELLPLHLGHRTHIGVRCLRTEDVTGSVLASTSPRPHSAILQAMLDQLEALEASLRRRAPMVPQDVALQRFTELLPAALEEL